MIPVTTLKSAVRKALQQLSRMKDVAEAEVYASSTEQLLCRLSYTSEIPCHGVEEPKSMESSGIGIRAVFTGSERPGGREVAHVGFGSEARDFSSKGIRRAIEKARQNAVPDPDFVCLPGNDSTGSSTSRRLTGYHDPSIIRMNDTRLVEAGWELIGQALETFSADAPASGAQTPVVTDSGARRGKAIAGPTAMNLAAQGLIVSGDLNVMRQRMAIASRRKPKGQPKIQTDDSTYVTASVTAMVERQHAKGTGYAAATHFVKLKGEAGSEAARNAIQTSGGQRLQTGSYDVVLGPQPVSDLVVNLLLPSLTAEAFYSSRSAFLGELGRPIAAELLTLYDHGALRGAVGSKGITCEGLPTGRTDLIRGGILTAVLSNHYETQRLMRDANARDKLGIHPQDHPEVLVPRNGFRLSNRGARQFDALPSISATNVFIEGTEPHTTESLFELVGNGVYIGRIWYTYPMNGLRAGDFTCTIVADSYLIRGGRLGAPLQSNTLRLTGNIRHLLHNIVGITKQSRPVLTWGSDEVVYAPEMAVRSLHLSEIAQFMQSV